MNHDRLLQLGIAAFLGGVAIAVAPTGPWRFLGIVLAVAGAVLAVVQVRGKSETPGKTGAAKTDPRKDVRSAFRRVEQRLDQVLAEAQRRPTVSTARAKADTALTWGLITEQTARDVHALVPLSDQAKHRTPGVSRDQASEYLRRVDDVLSRITPAAEQGSTP